MCECIARNPICFTCSHSKTPWRLFSIHAVLFATQNKYVANIFAYRTKSSRNRRQMDMDGKEKLHDSTSAERIFICFHVCLRTHSLSPSPVPDRCLENCVYLFCKSKRLKTTTTEAVKSTHIFPHSSQTSPGTDKRRRKGLEEEEKKQNPKNERRRTHTPPKSDFIIVIAFTVASAIFYFVSSLSLSLFFLVPCIRLYFHVFIRNNLPVCNALKHQKNKRYTQTLDN